MRRSLSTFLLFVLVAAWAGGCGSGSDLRLPRTATPFDPAAAGCLPPVPTVVPAGPEAAELLPGAAILFESAVAEKDLSQVRSGLRAARAYVGQSLGSAPDIVCIEVRSSEPSQAGSAVATGRHVVIFTSTEGWPEGASWHLQFVTAHEYVHVWQHEVAGEGDASVPAWLAEGAAEFVAFQALIEAGVLDASEVGSYITRAAGPLLPALDSLESPSVMNSCIDPYGVAYMGVRLLASTGGVSSLAAFWRGMNGRTTWQATFEQAFAMTPADFYLRFDSFRDNGFR